MAIINPAQIEWHGKEVRSMAEAVLESVYSNPELNAVHDIRQGIVALEQIVFLGILTKITKVDAGCGTGATSPAINMSEKFWNPAKVKIWIEECADNLEASFWIWGEKMGIDRDDLTSGDFAKFVMMRMKSAMLEDVWRIAWFNDTQNGNYSDTNPGPITNGVSTADYTIINGFWGQAYDIVAADSDRVVAISRNNQATFAAQRFTAQDTTDKVVHGILQDVKDNADFRLLDKPDLAFLVTQSIYNQYQKELKSYTAVNEAWIMVQEGKKVLSFDGIPVIPINFWDRTIQTDMSNGTKWYQPHRVFFTTKSNIVIGFDEFGAAQNMEQFYLPKEETTNWRSKYRIDAKILEDYLIQVAY